MGLIQKKDEKDEIDGIQIIERGEGPDGDEDEKIDLVAGTSAEHIAAGTTAEEEDARLEAKIAADAADENLMPEEQDEDDDSDEDDHASKHKKTMIAAFVVAVVIAAVVGFFIGNGGFGGKGVGSATLTEDQLDSTVASYSYNGKKSDITAREAIESQYSSILSRTTTATTPLRLPTLSCPTCATRFCWTLPRTRALPSLPRK